MAHLLEKYLDASKKSFLRQHLGEIIARQTQDDYAARYFKQRLAHAEILDLLKHHHNLTGIAVEAKIGTFSISCSLFPIPFEPMSSVLNYSATAINGWS
jgi:hypothetical protein